MFCVSSFRTNVVCLCAVGKDCGLFLFIRLRQSCEKSFQSVLCILVLLVMIVAVVAQLCKSVFGFGGLLFRWELLISFLV